MTMNEYTKELAYLRLAAFKALAGWGTENQDPEEKKWNPVIQWSFEKRMEKADELMKWMLREE